MNRSLTKKGHAHTVRADAFVAQMHATERAAVARAIEQRNMAEIERVAIARRIKQARKEAGLSQPEMADALGVIPRTYQNYESLKEPRTPWALMNQIATVTGKTTAWLIHGDGRPQTPDPFKTDGQLDRIEQAQQEILQLLRQLIPQPGNGEPLTDADATLPDVPLEVPEPSQSRRQHAG